MDDFTKDMIKIGAMTLGFYAVCTVLLVIYWYCTN
jgi:hypothetical protein